MLIPDYCSRSVVVLGSSGLAMHTAIGRQVLQSGMSSESGITFHRFAARSAVSSLATLGYSLDRTLQKTNDRPAAHHAEHVNDHDQDGK